jgi:hypothetical protein
MKEPAVYRIKSYTTSGFEIAENEGAEPERRWRIYHDHMNYVAHFRTHDEARDAAFAVALEWTKVVLKKMRDDGAFDG